MTRRDWIGLCLLGSLLVAVVALVLQRRAHPDQPTVFEELWASVVGDGQSLESRAVPGLGSGPAGGAKSAPKGPLRVLFLGNSYTAQSAVARLVTQLAQAAGVRPLETVVDAPAGAGFREHVASGRYEQHLTTHRFDYVVLQDQSQRSSFRAAQRETWMYAPARELHAAIAQHGARTLLFQTWARRQGDSENEANDTYAAMQERVVAGYRELAQELGAGVVPVGEVWRAVHEAEPTIALWKPDGSHPAPAGGYLTSCVMFRALYDRPVSGVDFYATLDPNDARRIQQLVDAHWGEAGDAPARDESPAAAEVLAEEVVQLVAGILRAPDSGCAAGYDQFDDICYHRSLDRDPAVRERAIADYRAGAVPPQVRAEGAGAAQ